jgi:hypothetical protein
LFLSHPQKDIILHDNDADLVLLNPDWDALLETLKARLPGFRVFFVVPSEDTSIRWIRVMSGVGIMDLVRRRCLWGFVCLGCGVLHGSGAGFTHV